MNLISQQFYDNTFDREYFNKDYVVSTKRQYQIKEQMEIYQWRKEQRQNVIRVLNYEEVELKGGKRKVKVWVEKMDRLLGQVGVLDWSDGVDLLKQCMKGYQILYRKFGLFIIEQRMIAINHKKQVRVWINNNFGTNSAIENYQNHALRNQTDMIKLIYEIVKPHIKSHPFSIKLKTSIQSSNNFKTAINSIENIQTKDRHFKSIASSKSSRKYFTKTPQNKLEIDRKREQYGNMKLSSHNQNQQNYKYQLNQTSCLQFKNNVSYHRQKIKTEPAFGNLENYFTIPSNNTSLNDMNQATPSKQLSFTQNQGEKSQRRYFGFKNSQLRNSKSRSRSNVKQSTITKGLSFKYQKKPKQSKNVLTSQNHMSKIRKRTKTGLNLSPSPIHNQIKRELSKAVTKSMLPIKQKILTKTCDDTTKQSNSGQCKNSEIIQQIRPRKLSDASDMLHMRMIKQSIINDNKIDTPKKSDLSLVSKLKNSIFNRVDDLKQSQIIFQQQLPEFNQIKLSTQTSLQTPKKLINIKDKQMTHSINLHPKYPTKTNTIHNSPLDQFNKFKRTESKFNDISKPNIAQEVTPINENPQQQI